MPRVSFGSAQRNENFKLIPEGVYLCRISRVKETRTSDGDAMWKLRLTVEEGRNSGRCLFDDLVFGSAATSRLRQFCSALRLPTDADFDLSPQRVKGRALQVVVAVENYQDNEGMTHTRNTVAFEGYLPVPKPAEVPSDADLPF